jgi:hypothetical protein
MELRFFTHKFSRRHSLHTFLSYGYCNIKNRNILITKFTTKRRWKLNSKRKRNNTHLNVASLEEKTKYRAFSARKQMC